MYIHTDKITVQVTIPVTVMLKSFSKLLALTPAIPQSTAIPKPAELYFQLTKILRRPATIISSIVHKVPLNVHPSQFNLISSAEVFAISATDSHPA